MRLRVIQGEKSIDIIGTKETPFKSQKGQNNNVVLKKFSLQPLIFYFSASVTGMGWYFQHLQAYIYLQS